MAQEINYAEYTRAAQRFRAEFPDRAWGLTFPLSGMNQYYKVPEFGGYFCFRALSHFTVELCGVFALDRSNGKLIEAALEVMRQCGFKKVKLDCFAGVLGVWEKAGFVTTSRRAWDMAYKPSLWRPEYGRQDVFYMERNL